MSTSLCAEASAQASAGPTIELVNTSLFELFKIGIGPSSSHTVGPMRAALRFAERLAATGALARTARIQTELFGSLALTGIGHATDRAILLGLLGYAPDTIDPAAIEPLVAEVRASATLPLLGQHGIAFYKATDLLFRRDQMYPDPDVVTHPNGMRFTAFDRSGCILITDVFYSIGGGFIVSGEEFDPNRIAVPTRPVPFPFRSAADLLTLAAAEHRTIADIVLANEIALLADPSIRRPAPHAANTPLDTPAQQVAAGILALWHVMQGSVARGLATEGILPGGLNVRRRAPRLAARLVHTTGDPLAPMDWVTVYAMAVNEENAAGGRVVTAPTNGAAGVIPAIAEYYLRFIDPTSATEPDAARAHEAGLLRYFLTAAAIGILYKENASISGAEVGCQGEVGVACSMAAGGLVAALGGSNAQIEHAAEIAMEHNLGMTCDPIGGLVQIPCIERNGMGAVKAINAARLALADTDTHKLSLDQIIETMYRTGLDMQSRYKETSLAGLALNIIEC